MYKKVLLSMKNLFLCRTNLTNKKLPITRENYCLVVVLERTNYFVFNNLIDMTLYRYYTY